MAKSCKLEEKKIFRCDSSSGGELEKVVSLQNLTECQHWCDTVEDEESRFTWHAGVFCSWDVSKGGEECKLSICDVPIMEDSASPDPTDNAAGICREVSDFNYDSHMWDADTSDFVEDPSASLLCENVASAR